MEVVGSAIDGLRQKFTHVKVMLSPYLPGEHVWTHLLWVPTI